MSLSVERVEQEGLPRELIIDGVYMPAHYTADRVLSARHYQPESTDVFVCSYPKAGATWTQMIVYMLLHNGQLPPKGIALNDISPAIEYRGCDYIGGMDRPRLLKSHMYHDFVPQNPVCKYIYVVRNPKDTLVSFYHHYLSLSNSRYHWPQGDLETFFELFCKGHVSYGDYYDHLLSWLPHIHDENVLFVKYEERLDDLASGVRKIGEFLGGNPLKLVRHEATLNAIVNECSFDSMKKDQRGRYFGAEAIRDGPLQFLRTGKKGDWRNHLNRRQSDTIDEMFRQKLHGTEAEHWYQKEMKWID